LSLAARSTSSSWPWESARREIDARAWALRGAVKVRVALPRLVLCYVARVRRASFDSCEVGFPRRDPLLHSSVLPRQCPPVLRCEARVASPLLQLALVPARLSVPPRPLTRVDRCCALAIRAGPEFLELEASLPRHRRRPGLAVVSRFGAARLDRRSEGLLAVCRACALPNLAGVDGLPRRTRRAQSASRPCRDSELVPAARNPRSLRLSSPSRHARVRSRRAGSRVLGRHHLPGCSPFTTACASALPVSCSSSTKPLVPPVCTSTYDTTEEDRLAGSNGVKNSCGWRGGKGEPGSRAPPCRPCSPVRPTTTRARRT
jgi:hypothetical protein